MSRTRARLSLSPWGPPWPSSRHPPVPLRATRPKFESSAQTLLHAGLFHLPCGGDADAGTVTTAFGTYMVSRGLQGGNNLLSLDGAIQGMVGEKSIYITYLQDGVDPNNPTSGYIPGITYGCFNVTGQGPSSGGLGLLLVALTVLFLLLRRRRSRTSLNPPPPAD